MRLLAITALAPLVLAAGAPQTVTADGACVIGKIESQDRLTIGRSLMTGDKISKAEENYNTNTIAGAALACSAADNWSENRMEGATALAASDMMLDAATESLTNQNIDVSAIRAWFDQQTAKRQQTMFADNTPEAETEAAIASLVAHMEGLGMPQATVYQNLETVAIALSAMMMRARATAGLKL
jgi:hypothetical protein